VRDDSLRECSLRRVVTQALRRRSSLHPARNNVANDAKKPAVRITGQFRSRDAMVYDFICNNVRIAISVSPSTPDDHWNAEAVAKQLPVPLALNGVGSSRGEAITALAETWMSKSGAEGAPWLDWSAIREALAAVKAI
jgi:hypothetical protein